MVYVDLPKVGATFAAGAVIAVIESVKAASDIYAPAGGEVVEVNSELVAKPELGKQGPLWRGVAFSAEALPARRAGGAEGWGGV